MAFLKFDLEVFTRHLTMSDPVGEPLLIALPPVEMMGLDNAGVWGVKTDFLWQEALLQNGMSPIRHDDPSLRSSSEVWGDRRLQNGHAQNELGQPDFMLMSPQDTQDLQAWCAQNPYDGTRHNNEHKTWVAQRHLWMMPLTWQSWTVGPWGVLKYNQLENVLPASKLKKFNAVLHELDWNRYRHFLERISEPITQLCDHTPLPADASSWGDF